MEPRTLVRHTKLGQKGDGERGVVAQSPLAIYFPGEVAVLWEDGFDQEVSSFYDPAELTSVGREEPVADLKRCGSGRGAECCIFLTMEGEGPTCQRFLSLHAMLLERAKKGEMGSRRIPKELFPNCQLLDGEKVEP